VAMLLTPVEHNGDIGWSLGVWIGGGVLTVAAIAVAATRRPHALLAATGVVLAVLVALELGGGQRHSAARSSLVDQPYTAMGGQVAEFLRQHPERNLSLAGTPPDDYRYLSNSLRPNANLTYGSRSLDGYDGGLWVTDRWVKAVEPLTTKAFNNDLPLTWQIEVPPNRELLARLGVKYIIIDAAGTADVYGLPDPTSAESQAKAAQIVAAGYRGPVLVDGPLQVWENPLYTAEGQVYFNTWPVADQGEDLIRRRTCTARTAGANRSSCDGRGPARSEPTWRSTGKGSSSSPSREPVAGPPPSTGDRHRSCRSTRPARAWCCNPASTRSCSSTARPGSGRGC
jgi:hypothetical protein